MFDYDISSGTLFQHEGKDYVVVKQLSWFVDKGESRNYIQVNICLPIDEHTEKTGEWVQCQPAYFLHIEEEGGTGRKHPNPTEEEIEEILGPRLKDPPF